MFRIRLTWWQSVGGEKRKGGGHSVVVVCLIAQKFALPSIDFVVAIRTYSTTHANLIRVIICSFLH